MADCVSVLAVTLVGDEKRRLGERRISAMGRFLLPSFRETSRLSLGLFPFTQAYVSLVETGNRSSQQTSRPDEP